MDWKKFFVVYGLGSVGVVAAATLGFGLFGFLLAGKEGFEGGIVWGFYLGLMALPFAGFTILLKFWNSWGSTFGRISPDFDGKPAEREDYRKF